MPETFCLLKCRPREISRPPIDRFFVWRFAAYFATGMLSAAAPADFMSHFRRRHFHFTFCRRCRHYDLRIFHYDARRRR